ncbi:MAG: FKBP-type peptidyl-prolyl cis-trans isomerase [Thermodesulfobacteriota bacterium]
MKKGVLQFVFILLLCGMAPTIAQAVDKNKTPAEEWSEGDKLSYIVGVQLGQLSKTSELGLNIELIERGLNDFKGGNEIAMSPQEIQKFMTDLQSKGEAKQMAALNAMSEENLKKGEAYLEANKKKKGVKVTASGLQYRVIAKGDGAKPTSSDRVKVHYRGTLVDGTEFDSSYKRDQPAEFAVSQVIKGWGEAVQLMKVGSKYEFYIPENLAYGKNGPPSIGPSQTLIFEIELLDIVK